MKKPSLPRDPARNSETSGRTVCHDRCARLGEANDEAGVIVLTCYRPQGTITLGGMAIVVAAFLLFKGLVIGHLGPAVHIGAVETLRHGSPVERAGAFLMWPDAVSLAIAAQAGPLLR